jgi:hypothetical protein
VPGALYVPRCVELRELDAQRERGEETDERSVGVEGERVAGEEDAAGELALDGLEGAVDVEPPADGGARLS